MVGTGVVEELVVGAGVLVVELELDVGATVVLLEVVGAAVELLDVVRGAVVLDEVVGAGVVVVLEDVATTVVVELSS